MKGKVYTSRMSCLANETEAGGSWTKPNTALDLQI